MNKIYAILPMFLAAGCYTSSNIKDPAEEMEPLVVSETVAMEETVKPVAPAPVKRQPVVQPQLSADGTTIELPPQQIYIGTPVPPIRQPNPYGTRTISYSTPTTVEEPLTTIPVYQPDFITLQYTGYPNTFVQCAIGDYMCVSSYEQQGFVQIQNKPRFAGYQDVTLSSDYPEGKWRYGNNIPRW